MTGEFRELEKAEESVKRESEELLEMMGESGRRESSELLVESRELPDVPGESMELLEVSGESKELRSETEPKDGVNLIYGMLEG